MTLDDIRKLHDKKYRSRFGCFLVEGEHLVLELQKASASNPALLESRLYVSGNHEHWQGPLRKQVLDARQMARISATETPQGIVAVVPLSALPGGKPSRSERAVYLHEVQDPGNLGSILRSMAWFGGFRCLLSPGCVDHCSPKVVRASMGAVFHVPVETSVSLASLPERFTSLACLDMQGKSLPDPAFRHHDCFVFGNEARGLTQQTIGELGAVVYTIQGSGTIDSLNLAATVGIGLYEISTAVQLLA